MNADERRLRPDRERISRRDLFKGFAGVDCTARLAAVTFVVAALVGSAPDGAAADWPGWLDRAPLNADNNLVGLQHGLAMAYRTLAILVNLAVLAGLLHFLARDEMDFSYFIYVYIAIPSGSIVLSYVLSPYLGAFSVLPIIAFTTFLLVRFCCVSLKRALLVTLLFHVYQVLYLLAYQAIATRYA